MEEAGKVFLGAFFWLAIGGLIWGVVKLGGWWGRRHGVDWEAAWKEFKAILYLFGMAVVALLLAGGLIYATGAALFSALGWSRP